MFLALLRIIEPHTGTILIDGVDILQVGLDDLRRKITIIPQVDSTYQILLSVIGSYAVQGKSPF